MSTPTSTKRTSTKPAADDDTGQDPETIIGTDYPPSVALVEGFTVEGDFEAVEPGPDMGYGPVFIVLFTGVSGQYMDPATNELRDIAKDERYSVWLFHTSLASQFERAAPDTGERFTVTRTGRQLKKSAPTGSQDDADYFFTYMVTVPRRGKLTWGRVGKMRRDAK